ncbi:MAG TPA: folate-binding protein [Lacunisphaera sp.]|nr:folate-binding protein [Lacunisphaera sp.]
MIFGMMMIHEYRPMAVLRVTGADAFVFLQGQFTNDLRQPTGSAVYGLWLNHKGKVVADSHVLRLAENEFLLVSTTTTSTVIQQRLEAFIVADDVTLRDETANAHGLALGGPGCGDAIKQVFGGVPGAGRLVRSNGAMIFPGRRRRTENYEIIGAEEILAETKKQFVARGCVEAGVAEMDLARISAVLPAIPQDLGPGDLPNEGGLEESVISYTKGCYLGQEIMARLKNMGKVRRRLHVVRGAGAPPRPSTLLYQGEKKVGEVRSSASKGDEFVALAMLSLINLDQAAGLSLSPNGPPGLRLGLHE